MNADWKTDVGEGLYAVRRSLVAERVGRGSQGDSDRREDAGRKTRAGRNTQVAGRNGNRSWSLLGSSLRASSRCIPL